jgi:predicted nucleic acid-binding protein
VDGVVPFFACRVIRECSPYPPLEESFDFIDAVRAYPGHVTAEAGAHHLDCLRGVCSGREVAADLMPDAVLAALVVEHGGEVVSFDRDFGRFPDLHWIRPEP